MTLTLTANIDAADRYLTVTGTVPDDIEPTYQFRLGNELLELQAFVVKVREVGRAGTFIDRNEWYVLRGLDTTTAASHTAGDEVKGATDAYAAATSGTTPPSPFSSGGGGGLPTGWTQNGETGAVDTGGQDLTVGGTFSPIPTLSEVLAEGNDANGESIDNLYAIAVTDSITINSATVATEAYAAAQVGGQLVAGQPEGSLLCNDGAGGVAFSGIVVDAGAPGGSPGAAPPFYYDTTSVTGGFYIWNGSTWVKVATIL